MKHNLSNVTEWKPVPGHPTFQIGFIDECNIPHTLEHMRYPYPIRRDNGKIVRIEPKYSERYIKAMIDGKPLNIHRLYQSAANPCYAAGMVVDHIDRNTHNNVLSNLRWVTPSENSKNRDIRRKYMRSISHDELPDNCIKLEGTNVLYNITRHDDGTIDEIFMYSPIGKGDTDYREFDLTMNTIEAEIMSGSIFIKYNPMFGKDEAATPDGASARRDGKRLSVTALLHRLRHQSIIPEDIYRNIYNRKQTIKDPVMIERIRQIINKSGYIKGGSRSFIISYCDMCNEKYDR